MKRFSLLIRADCLQSLKFVLRKHATQINSSKDFNFSDSLGAYEILIARVFASFSRLRMLIL
jgi:hypothetical protein